MTGHKENELLRDILLDAAAEEFAPEFSSTEQVETSLKFQKSMQSLLSNPKKWAERRQKAGLEASCKNGGNHRIDWHPKLRHADAHQSQGLRCGR